MLKDKGTNNQGWWLQLSNADELAAYLEKTAPTVYGNVLENYVYGKNHGGLENNRLPHEKEGQLTLGIYQIAGMKNIPFMDAMIQFRNEAALRQLHEIEEHGSIFVNRVGGYHAASEYDKCYNTLFRNDLVFPQFTKEDIRVKKFPYGQHYYAYIDDMQIKDGDTVKWNSYEEAYGQAKKLVMA